MEPQLPGNILSADFLKERRKESFVHSKQRVPSVYWQDLDCQEADSGFSSRVVFPYNEDLCVDQVSSHITDFSLEPHSPLTTANAWGIRWTQSSEKIYSYSKFTVSIYWHPPVLSPLWKDFHLQRKSCSWIGAERKFYSFLILPGTNTSRTIPSWDSRISDSRDSNAKSHERNWSPMNCGHTHSLKCCLTIGRIIFINSDLLLTICGLLEVLVEFCMLLILTMETY